MTVLYEAFYPYENLCVAAGFVDNRNAMKEMDEFIRNSARDGVSLVAVEKCSGSVVAVAINKLHVKASAKEYKNYLQNYIEKSKEMATKELLKLTMDFEEKCDFFKILNVDCSLEIMCLATLPTHRGMKIASRLCKATLMLAEALYRGENVKVSLDDVYLTLDWTPKVVWGTFTSPISQKIAKKLGFFQELVLSQDDLICYGKKYSDKTKKIIFQYKLVK